MDIEFGKIDKDEEKTFFGNNKDKEPVQESTPSIEIKSIEKDVIPEGGVSENPVKSRGRGRPKIIITLEEIKEKRQKLKELRAKNLIRGRATIKKNRTFKKEEARKSLLLKRDKLLFEKRKIKKLENIQKLETIQEEEIISPPPTVDVEKEQKIEDVFRSRKGRGRKSYKMPQYT